MDELTRQNPAVPSSVREEEGAIERWRLRLLPLMTRMLVGLTVFFFVISLAQITYLHWRVDLSPSVDLTAPMHILSEAAAGSEGDAMSASNAMIMAKLEANALARRYHQASVVLMARVWTSYMGFMTGMILALVGAAFTLGRVHDVYTEIEAKSHDVGAALKTSAPGIVLATLGVALMISTLFVPYKIFVTDKAVYSRVPAASAVPPDTEAPHISFPTATDSATADSIKEEP